VNINTNTNSVKQANIVKKPNKFASTFQSTYNTKNTKKEEVISEIKRQQDIIENRKDQVMDLDEYHMKQVSKKASLETLEYYLPEKMKNKDIRMS